MQGERRGERERVCRRSMAGGAEGGAALGAACRLLEKVDDLGAVGSQVEGRLREGIPPAGPMREVTGPHAACSGGPLPGMAGDVQPLSSLSVQCQHPVQPRAPHSCGIKSAVALRTVGAAPAVAEALSPSSAICNSCSRTCARAGRGAHISRGRIASPAIAPFAPSAAPLPCPNRLAGRR